MTDLDEIRKAVAAATPRRRREDANGHAQSDADARLWASGLTWLAELVDRVEQERSRAEAAEAEVKRLRAVQKSGLEERVERDSLKERVLELEVAVGDIEWNLLEACAGERAAICAYLRHEISALNGCTVDAAILCDWLDAVRVGAHHEDPAPAEPGP